MGKCHFNPTWLEKKDNNGYFIKNWGRKESGDKLFCTVCPTTISISGGFQSIIHHASTAKHKEQSKLKLQTNQLRLTSDSEEAVAGSSRRGNTSVRIYSVRDKATVAEIYWILKCCISNVPANFCEGIEHLFRSMFEGGVPEDFSLSRTKFTYVLNHGIAPYFHKELEKDMAGAYYTTCFDETTNASGNKELQVTVRYWSTTHQQVLSAHLQTVFIGSATAEVLFGKLKDALTAYSLPRTKMLMLGCDGPTTNQKVLRLLNDDLIRCRGKALLQLGTCNIHILHNAFLKGLNALGDEASDLIIAIYYFFNGWPSRVEDYKTIQNKLKLPQHSFIKHCSSRWLTLEGAAKRLLEQWEGVTEYFLKFLPNKKSQLLTKQSYLKIVRLIKSPTMKAELHFVCSSASVFTRFTATFQRNEPLIHLLHSELRYLVKTLMRRVCKSAAIKTHGVSPKTLEPENLLPVADIECGDEVSKALAQSTERDRLHFRKHVQTHYLNACSHILNKSALSTPSFTEHCRCLHPSQRTSLRSCNDIVALARALPLDIAMDTLLDEWKLLQIEKDLDGSKDGRIDSYWSQFFSMKSLSGMDKYPTVSAVVKAVLCLSHGQADVERGFSSSGRTLTDDRTAMSERTLDSYMMVKSVMQLYNNCPHLVPMTRELLASAHNAHAKYKLHLEEEKAQKKETLRKEKDEIERVAMEKTKAEEMEKERKRLDEEKDKLKILRKEEGAKRKTAETLFTEANKRLKLAIEKKNMQEINLAHAMLQGVSQVRKEADEQSKEASDMEKTVERRTNKLMSDFFSKTSKNKPSSTSA